MSDEEKIYATGQKVYRILVLCGLLLVFIVCVLSLCVGNYKTTFAEVIMALIKPEEYSQIFKIVTLSRLPRLLAAILVGASLSVAGLTYQDVFSNRMASPDILGVSAGAGVGASISIYFGMNLFLTGIMAFWGGTIAVILTVLSSKLFGKNDNTSASLILSGIVVGGLMNSLLGLFKYLSNDSQLASITFWLLGGFYNTSYRQLTYAAPPIVLGLVTLFLLRWKIVMLRAGDNDAYSHGINARLLRQSCILITTTITAVSICISGTIGWIGLAIPNLMRLLAQNDGKKLMPLSAIYGILFTASCDLLARTITNTEIPVGIISGVLGAAMFIIVLLIQNKRSER